VDELRGLLVAAVHELGGRAMGLLGELGLSGHQLAVLHHAGGTHFRIRRQVARGPSDDYLAIGVFWSRAKRMSGNGGAEKKNKLELFRFAKVGVDRK